MATLLRRRSTPIKPQHPEHFLQKQHRAESFRLPKLPQQAVLQRRVTDPLHVSTNTCCGGGYDNSESHSESALVDDGLIVPVNLFSSSTSSFNDNASNNNHNFGSGIGNNSVDSRSNGFWLFSFLQSIIRGACASTGSVASSSSFIHINKNGRSSSSSNNNKNHSKNTSDVITAKLKIISGLVVILAPWIHHSSQNWSAAYSRESMQVAKATFDDLDYAVQKATQSLKIVQDQLNLVEHENAAKMKRIHVSVTAEDLATTGTRGSNDDVAAAANKTTRNDITKNILGSSMGPPPPTTDDVVITSTTKLTAVQSSRYIEAEKEEQRYFSRISELENTLKEKAARNVQTRHGKGPTYRIQVNLKHFEDSSAFSDFYGGRGEQQRSSAGSSFVIETAPIDLMPHTIEYLFRMIEQNIWDGFHFMPLHKNGFEYAEADEYNGGKGEQQQTAREMDFIQTVSLSSSSSISSTTLSSSSDKENYITKDREVLTKLAFAESTKSYPIEKYSVVFSGRPGGPHFFIDMNDSMKMEQQQPKRGVIADAAIRGKEKVNFGKVVQGQDVLDAIITMSKEQNTMSSSGGSNNHETFLLGIESIQILSSSNKE